MLTYAHLFSFSIFRVQPHTISYMKYVLHELGTEKMQVLRQPFLSKREAYHVYAYATHILHSVHLRVRVTRRDYYYPHVR